MDGNEGKLPPRSSSSPAATRFTWMAIGGSAIKQLLAKGIQPIRVDQCDLIHELLAEVSERHDRGRCAWIDRAIAAQKRSDERFAGDG